MLIACTLIGVSGVAAEEMQARLQVGTRVAAHVRLSASAPPQVLVTARDVGRGYVDVPEPSRLDIRTNARAFALEIEPLAAPFNAVAISGLEQRVEFGSEGGSIIRRVTDTSQPVTLALRYRLQLGAGAAPGAYAWPVRLGVRPLAPAGPQ
ncbi:MAG: hypothetical protein IT480_03500 [Gammaproteobacteria bacterium]|nr:hypothetical protein [Gammaproteobacteria bacterium]